MSGYIGPAPVPQATQTRQTFTATSGQTSFATVGYVAGGQFIQVYLNGVLLKLTDDYTAANGSDILLTSGAATGDILEFITFADFTVNNQNFTGGLTVDNDGSTVLTVDRATSDGAIIDLQKSGSSVGSIGTKNGALHIGSTTGSDSYLGFYSNSIIPTTSDGSDRNNAIDLGYTDSRFKDLYLSGGVVFGATGGSVTSKTLDDYEEGTWTPAYSGILAATYQTPSTQGRYVKIGRMVWATAVITTSSLTQSGAGVQLTLPFTVASNQSNYSPPSFFFENGFAPAGGAGNIQGLTTTSGNHIVIYTISSSTGNNYTSVSYNDLAPNATTRVRYSVCYEHA